jgi:hypothetical protein
MHHYRYPPCLERASLERCRNDLDRLVDAIEALPAGTGDGEAPPRSSLEAVRRRLSAARAPALTRKGRQHMSNAELEHVVPAIECALLHLRAAAMIGPVRQRRQEIASARDALASERDRLARTLAAQDRQSANG